MSFLENPTDIGGGVSIEFVVHDGCPKVPLGETHECGAFIRHFHADGKECVGSVMWCRKEGEKGSTWELISRDPLTLSPSILQRSGPGPDSVECLHGFIRNGKWESC